MLSVNDKTIGKLQDDLAAAILRLQHATLSGELEPLGLLIPPSGKAARIAIERKKPSGRQREKIRTDAKASTHWDPALCKIVVSFEDVEAPAAVDSRSAVSSSAEMHTEPVWDLVKCLDSAERDPRFREFVGIKTFRDKYLVEHNGAWAYDPARRHAVLAKAIEQGVVLRNSVPNPREPNFPTTAIRVNREHPDTKRILGVSTTKDARFRPIPITGVPLSFTVLSERR